MGKLADHELKKLLDCIKKDPRVIYPPAPGFDSGVHTLGNRYVVISTDPCIGVPRNWFGWLLVNYAASDVALFGAKPEFCTINLLGPPKTRLQTFVEVMKQTCHAADELEMSIVTGHTGTYRKMSALVGVCTAYGTVDKEKLITPSGARVGDEIFCIKDVGLEVIVNFALTRKRLASKFLGVQQIRELSKLVYKQSCVNEALLLAKIGGVHAMHDVTEGGLTAALNEMAEASKVGFEIHYDRIPIASELIDLQKHFQLSDRELLSTSSTGTILAAVSHEARREAEYALRQNKVDVSVLGHFTENRERYLLGKSMKRPFPTKAEDPYERILSGKV